MPFYYFLPIPKLDRSVSDQSNQVELVQWLVQEGDRVEPGTPVAHARTRLAVVQIETTTPGIVGRLIFDRSTHVNVGDPIGVIYADGEDLPYGKAPSRATVLEVLKVKPHRRGSG